MLSPEDHALFKAYYHNETAYYIKRLERYLEGKRYSFNIKAFFLSVFYLSYRKMYKWIVIYLLAALIIGVMQSLVFLGFYEQMSQSTLTGINQLFKLIFLLVLAFYANKIYIEESIRGMIEIKEKTTDHKERLRLAAKKGGVNWIAPFLLLVGFLFLWSWLANR